MTAPDQYQLRVKHAPMSPAQYLPVIYTNLATARTMATRHIAGGVYGCVDIMRVSAPGVPLYHDPVKHYVSNRFLTQVQNSPALRALVARPTFR